jgi:threonine dehydratase
MAEPNKIVSLDLIYKASRNIKGVMKATLLMFVKSFSDRYHALISFKREDLQVVRSYKLRGAYNKIKILSSKGFEGGVVFASAGNHAQGVAFVCK